MCGLMWVFCEWANKIKARKFVPQQGQRSRISWLKHGYKNISFFHTKASSRYQRNTIQGVLDETGCW